MNTRGNQKIAGAARAFDFDFRGKRVLDIGSSTGGFTEYALKSGAAMVVAVEKGARQMMAPLRFSPQVELHEKTDIFDYKTEKAFDVIVADVSFISLRPVLEYAARELASSKTDFLVMLKPQFEATDVQLNRGVVKNERIRREIIREFEAWLVRHNFVIIKKRDNELAGKKGNVERFYWLRLQ